MSQRPELRHSPPTLKEQKNKNQKCFVFFNPSDYLNSGQRQPLFRQKKGSLYLNGSNKPQANKEWRGRFL